MSHCCQCHQHHKPLAIKNRKSGLVLEGREDSVKLQPYAGTPEQLWTLECIDHGRFIIINKATGKVLDIQGGVKNAANLITFKRHGGLNQQWYIHSNSIIVSAGGNLAVDIHGGKYTPGNQIIAFNTHGKENQQFEFVYQ